jgi:hypothetical protein
MQAGKREGDRNLSRIRRVTAPETIQYTGQFLQHLDKQQVVSYSCPESALWTTLFLSD